jgi:1-acyl-sn-glycerol-3-phosphate acyltransferase
MRGVWRHPIRFLFRFAELAGLFLGAGADFVWRFGLARSACTPRDRAEWMQRWARVALRVFRARVEVHGPLPSGGLLASNHLSYVDIVVLGVLQPTVFVSKADVRRWPVLGWCAQAAGTLFLNREQRGHVAEIGRRFAPLLDDQLAVVMFLEGTSTGGDRVLAFRPALLAPAVANDWPVTPVWIGYTLPHGSVENEVAYWRDMTLLPHLLNLLTRRDLTAHVAFGESIRAGAGDRKELARRLHLRVCELARGCGRTLAAGSAPMAKTAPLE